ncbi:hypothetical protein GCM10009603_01870 [Nocardiopsis exhalans]
MEPGSASGSRDGTTAFSGTRSAAMSGLQLRWPHDPAAVDMPALIALLSETLRVGEHTAPGD